MTTPARFPPIVPRVPRFLHGGDYNPDQWPEAVWDEDMRLFREAHCNVATVGIFAWARLEPADGQFDFAWLDAVMDNLAANGLFAILATPTAAHPRWLTDQCPEVQRADERGVRSPHRNRVNFCLTSPVYREKAARITRQPPGPASFRDAASLRPRWRFAGSGGILCIAL
jgi:beta-galactosidase